jgi:general secretion pathway protein C
LIQVNFKNEDSPIGMAFFAEPRSMAALSVPGVLLGPANWFSRRWIGLTSFALLVLLCWLLANWTWIFLPRPANGAVKLTDLGSQSMLPPSAGEVIARHLFGEPNAEVAAAVPVVVASPLNAKLKGVFAGLPPFPAFAILNFDGKDQPVKVGTDIIPGAMLESVFPRHVLVRRNGASEKIEFENDVKAASPGIALSAPQMAQRLPPPPSQFRLNVQSVNQNTSAVSRGELQSALQDPRQLTNIGQVQDNPGGGVSVQGAPQGSLLQKLGLLDGDVIRSLNGVPVNSQADLMRLYQHFGQVGQVKVEGLRAGTPLQLNYNIRQ